MEMEIQDDFCRFCKQNMRMVGLHKYSVNIFDRFGKPSISERLFHVGVAVVNRPVSNRICRRCVTFLTRLERDLPVYRRWIEDERHDEASASPADKRDRELTPSKTPLALIKLWHNPASPSRANVRNNIAEGIREEKGSMTTVQDQRVKSEPDDLVISETALLTPPATTEDVKAECASELGLNEGGSILTVLSVESKPGTANSSCRIFPPVRHVASQTDPPKIKSIGTQLSMQTLQNPFRSKATQVKMPGRDCGVCTDTFPLDSPLLLLQPTLVKRPSKRPRLSLTDEEEGPSESSLSVVVHEPEDST
ncbi:uncharacterized protein LOC117945737 isoform X1 [Etheostoma cragini]|uniref:uncharacterized protein LOC117945737 isoform X1 n=1 Tax=Etheostoma cragini TaxID=417921 RepID=UPI00155F07F2|nr:uncharacterized protein LOC117945737 isoform X1 [Etheostoma cragini]